jgi:hypothetical protein
MWPKLIRKVEILLGIALIIAVLILSVLLINLYSVNHRQRVSPLLAEIYEITPGATVNLTGENWAQNGQTLLLGLSTGCESSTSSAPFYQRLKEQHTPVKIVALLPQTKSEAETYLNNAGIVVDEVRQTSMGSVGIPRTPTLVLVNERGIATNVWVGKLSGDQENLVVRRLRMHAKGSL